MREINKKNLLLIAVSAAVIGGAFVLAEIRNTAKKNVVYVESEVNTNSAFAASLSITDTDNDGLKDWEEELWGLNPNSKDSNRNGIPDGDEVTGLIKNNQSALAKATVNTKTTNSKPTKTEEFSKKFFSNYLELRRSGNLTDENIQDLVARMSEPVTETAARAEYSTKNVTILKTSDVTAIKNYANSFGAIRERYKKSYENNQVRIGEDGPNFEDPNFLKDIARVSNLYKNMTTELSKIPVPEVLADTHISLLNTYSLSALGLYEISTISKDPLTAIKGIARHNEATQMEIVHVEEIATFLTQKGITFTLGEGGYFFEKNK